MYVIFPPRGKRCIGGDVVAPSARNGFNSYKHDRDAPTVHSDGHTHKSRKLLYGQHEANRDRDPIEWKQHTHTRTP